MLTILITLDCLRKDHFCEELTPGFMKGLGDWVSFGNGFSQSQNTLSSHFTMLTSSYLFQHGVYSNFKGKRLPPSSIDGRLRDAGFRTKAFCGVSFLSGLLGNQVGEKDDYFDRSGGRIIAGIKRRLRGDRRPAEKVVAEGIKWLLRASPSKGAFLWLHLFDAHMAYSAPRRHMKKFAKEKASGKSVREQIESRGWFSPYFREYEKRVDISYFPGAYKAAVRYIDESLSALFSVLKSLGMFDPALIFVTSDHGECLMGEHDIYCAHKKLFDETINVPFFVKFPGSEFGGTASDLIVEHTDIAPTIAAAASVSGAGYEGLDLRALLKGDAAPRAQAFSEHVDNFMRSVRSCDRIYVEKIEGAENKWGMKEEKEKLFDRSGSPVADPALELMMKASLEAFMKEREKGGDGSGDQGGGGEEIERQLRSLGYL